MQEIRYLGVRIESKRNMFEGHRKDLMSKAKMMSNLTYLFCNREKLTQSFNRKELLEGSGLAKNLVWAGGSGTESD